LGGVKSEQVDGPGWLPFDLLGQPVPKNMGMKGRRQHAPSPENLEKAILLYGLRRSDAEVASALGLSIPTMKLHYFSSPDLQAIRRNARAFVEGELLARLNRDSLGGKTGATEKLLKRLDKAGLDAVGFRVKERGKAEKPAQLGKKEEQKLAAQRVGGKYGPRSAPAMLIN